MKKILPVLITIVLLLCSCSSITDNVKQYTETVIDDIIQNETDIQGEEQVQDESVPQPAETNEIASGAYVQDNGTGVAASESIMDISGNQTNWYAYQSLSDDLKKVYLEIISILDKQENDIKLSTTDTEAIDHVFDCIFMDHPEFFWVDGYTLTQYKLNRVVKSVAFSGNYIMTKEDRLLYQTKIDDVVYECLNGLPQDASEYEKVKYVYEYVINSTDYNLQAENNQNIISVFLNRQSVCQGYAYAVHYLLNHLDIPCTTVTGTVNNGNPHSWNLVKVYGKYYYVDATWGDCGYITENTEESSLYSGIGDINYDFLLITTEMLNRTHTISSAVPMPECNTMDANYYVQEGKYFSGLDKELLKSIFDQGYARNDVAVSVMCQDQAVFEELYQYLIKDSNIFDYIRSSEKVTYIKNEEQLTYQFFL